MVRPAASLVAKISDKHDSAGNSEAKLLVSIVDWVAMIELAMSAAFLVFQDLAAFKCHAAAGLGGNFAGGLERNVFSFDRDRSILLHRDARSAGLESDLASCFDH